MPRDFRQITGAQPHAGPLRGFTGLGVKIQGHLKIVEYANRASYDAGEPSRTLLNRRNAVHKENAVNLVVNALTGRANSAVTYMVFGNGGTTLDNTGTISFNAPHVSGAGQDLYNPVLFQMVDDNMGALPGNQMAVRHIHNTLFTDMDIRCLIDANTPFGQISSDEFQPLTLKHTTALGSPQPTTPFIFDEIGLKLRDGTLLTHVVFVPILKTASSLIEVVYTLRLAVGIPAPVNNLIIDTNIHLLGVGTGAHIGTINTGFVQLTGVYATTNSGIIGGFGATWRAFNTGFIWRSDVLGGNSRYAPGEDNITNLVMNGDIVSNVASGTNGNQLYALTCDNLADAIDAWFGTAVVIRSGTYIGTSPVALVPICQGKYILAQMQAGSPHSINSESYKWFALLDPTGSVIIDPTCLGAVAYNSGVTGPPYLALYAITASGIQSDNDPILLLGSNNIGGHARSLVVIPSAGEIVAGTYKNGFNHSFPLGAGYVWQSCEVPFCFYGTIATANLTLDLYEQNDGGMWSLPGPSGGTNLYFYFNKTYTTYCVNNNAFANVEVRDVIGPAYPNGSIIKIPLSNGPIDFVTIAQSSVNDGSPSDGSVINGSGVTPMYTIDNANWRLLDSSPAVPFIDEYTIVMTGASGGNDVYSPMPVATINNGDGTWTVGHLMWGNSDNSISFVRTVSLRKFTYTSSTSIAVQQSRTADRLYTTGEAPNTGGDITAFLHYNGSTPIISGYHNFSGGFFGPSSGVTFRSTFGNYTTINQKNVGGGNFTGTQTIIVSPVGLNNNNGKGVLSFWYNRGNHAGSEWLLSSETVLNDDQTPISISFNDSSHPVLRFQDPTGLNSVSYSSTAFGTPDVVFGEWVHYIFAWDMGFLTDPRDQTTVQLIFMANRNRISMQRTITGTAKWNVNYADATSWRFFGPPLTSRLNTFGFPYTGMQGDIAEFWFAPGVFLDIGDPDILNNWVSPDQSGVVHPAKMGTSGELPLLGTTPFVYFSANPDVSGFPINLGYGGTATLSGSITNSLSRP